MDGELHGLRAAKRAHGCGVIGETPDIGRGVCNCPSSVAAAACLKLELTTKRMLTGSV